MLTPREKSPQPEKKSPQMRIEPTTLHPAGQRGQHTTNELFPSLLRLWTWLSAAEEEEEREGRGREWDRGRGGGGEGGEQEGKDLFRQLYVLPYWQRRCRLYLLSDPVTVYLHRANQSYRGSHNARRVAGHPLEWHILSDLFVVLLDA